MTSLMLMTTDARIRCDAPARVRRLAATQLGCSPFEVVVRTSHRVASVQTHMLQGPGYPLSSSECPQPGVHLDAVPSVLGDTDIKSLALSCARAMAYLAQHITSHREQRLVIGRPLLFAAIIGHGSCRLEQYAYADFQVYRCVSEADRLRAYATHQWAQDWLASCCSRGGWRIKQQPGCVLAMAAGGAIG